MLNLTSMVISMQMSKIFIEDFMVKSFEYQLLFELLYSQFTDFPIQPFQSWNGKTLWTWSADGAKSGSLRLPTAVSTPEAASLHPRGRRPSGDRSRTASLKCSTSERRTGTRVIKNWFTVRFRFLCYKRTVYDQLSVLTDIWPWITISCIVFSLTREKF
jgi:hypothetical protein